MIRELRRRHLALAASLAVAAPLLAAGAIRARGGDVLVARLPATDPAPPGARLELSPGFPLAVAASRSGDSVRLVVAAPAPLGIADALLYWAADPPADGRLPPAAVLLGPVGHGRAAGFRVARGALAAAGHLVLWSNARGELAAATPVTLPPEVR